MSYTARTLTDAVIAHLEALDVLVGDAGQPEGSGWQGAPDQSTFIEYLVVHRLAGDTDGDLDLPYDVVAPIYHLNAYGGSRQQADLLADRARERMLAVPLVIDRNLAQLRWDWHLGVQRFDDAAPPLWAASDRYQIVTSS